MDFFTFETSALWQKLFIALQTSAFVPLFLYAPLPFDISCLLLLPSIRALQLFLSSGASNPQISSIRQERLSEWTLFYGNGRHITAKLQNSSVVTVYFAITHWQTSEGKKRILLFRDMCPSEAWRQLRVALRYQ